MVPLRFFLLICVAIGFGPLRAAGQEQAPSLPFAPGDTLVYEGEFGRFGSSGSGTLTVSKSEWGERALIRFDFDFRGRVLLMRVRDQTSSWIDPTTFTSYRYEKDESHPLGSRKEAVRIYPAERRWEDAYGGGGQTPADNPLDELSILFYLRTLELEEGVDYTMDRHFDEARSPIEVEVLGEDSVTVPAGNFRVTVVEMRVTDPDRFGGDGRVVLYLAHDEYRTPVRIESSVPVAGSLVLSLQGYSLAAERHQATETSSRANLAGEIE